MPYGAKEREGEAAPDHGADLRHLARRPEPVEPRHESSASKICSGFCQASRSGLSNSLAHLSASSNR